MENIDPENVPLLARKMARWNRKHGPRVMSEKGMRGSRFFAPPSLPPMVHEAVAYAADLETGRAYRLPDEATMNSYEALAEYYADTLEHAQSFYLSPEMTHLAMRTQMTKYKLTLDTLPQNKPYGFIVWGQPIGGAEKHLPINFWVEFRSENPRVTYELDEFNPYADAALPIVAASWRYEPEANSVWVAFYTQQENLYRDKYSPKDFRKIMEVMGPLALEREQELPLDQILDWYDADSQGGPKLEPTARMDYAQYPEGTHELLRQQEEAGFAELGNLVRILIASWVLMNWKIAHREVIPAPPSVAREVAKATGKSKAEAARDAGTTVIRLGAPLRQRKAKRGDREYVWDHRTIVGPVVRARQYVPAHDTFIEGPHLIEPFFMGPPDAPIRNIDKVFLLE